ncbi:MAG: hypothetical protein IT265_12220 [Saprospiraceae bacterium]|nr:hypothetical protein [Saprospiraceae bacterium]
MKLNKITSGILVVIFLNIYLFNNVFGQCGSGGIILTRQGEIDSFGFNYPACHRIKGNVIIENTNIKNLDGLSVIDTIDEYFNLSSNYQLLNIEGLRNIQSVQDIYIYDDTLLTTLNGFRNLLDANNSLSIVGLPKISNLEGLNRLKFTRQFYVGNCSHLQNLSGIDSLARVQSFRLLNNANLDTLLGLNPSLTYDLNPLEISECSKLRSLIPFPKLKSIWQFNMMNNEQLINLNGMDSVERITYLTISENKHLEDISALSQIKNIQHYARIINNPELSDIGSFRNIDLERMDSLVLVDNPLLTYCHYPNICDYLSNTNNYARIQGNALHCEDRSSISAQCQLLPFKLLDFTATLDQSKVALNWITVNETKLRTVSLEHQDPSGSWNIIDSMSIAYQKLAGKNYYRFIHDAPQQGDNNYQLRFEDLAGNSKYSQVLTVYLKTTGTEEYISQQTKNSFWLESPSKICSFILFDQMGRVVKNGNGHSTLVEVQCADIPSGLYFLRLELENKIHISIKLFL